MFSTKTHFISFSISLAWGTGVKKRAHALAETIKSADHIHIVTHIDADGISAGAIAVQTLQRLGKAYSIECIKQLDELVIKRLMNQEHELVWFTDLGSGISTSYPEIPKIITDHHTCPANADLPFHLNPHLFGFDGSHDISGAGVTYLVATAVDAKNADLSALAIVGACGDLQDRKEGKLIGLNRDILNEGIQHKVISPQLDISFFGRETRSLTKLLQYANDPLLPGLSRREDACESFLQNLGIRLKHRDDVRRWIDLSKDEKRVILSGLAQLLLTKGFGYQYASRLISECYHLCNEEVGTELHDAQEFATLLNSTARYGQPDVGINVCLGDRGKELVNAKNLLSGHRVNLVEGLQFAREEEIHKRSYVQFFHAKHGIRDTIVGIVTNMLLNTEDVDAHLPLIGFAYTEHGDVKASARATQQLVDNGLNLSDVMKNAASSLGGVGGGHSIAAGATIPKGKEEEFINRVEQAIKAQLSS